jgi:hypothetical protein
MALPGTNTESYTSMSEQFDGIIAIGPTRFIEH